MDLLRQAQAGDESAYTELHHQLEPAIRRFVYRLIGTGEEAEDVVQDTMIAFYRSLHRIDPPEHMRAYVYRIARNRCYDALRRQGRYETLPLDDDAVAVRVSFDYSKRRSQTPRRSRIGCC
ncbi:MAG: RNA polymerase sigma factor [Chloroflexi bacterium]|nr:RNA polymerase sigma factor [Chloroflexota bacterium]